MKIKYDQVEFDLPQSAVEGLEAFLIGVAKGMAKADPESADCWTWGRAWIDDLSNAKGIEFQWGGDEDRPAEVTNDFAVVQKLQKGDTTR